MRRLCLSEKRKRKESWSQCYKSIVYSQDHKWNHCIKQQPFNFFSCIWDNDYILRTWTRTGQMKHLEKAEAINQRESQHIPGVHVGFMMLLLLFCKTVNLKNLLKTIIINMYFCLNTSVCLALETVSTFQTLSLLCNKTWIITKRNKGPFY